MREFLRSGVVDGTQQVADGLRVGNAPRPLCAYCLTYLTLRHASNARLVAIDLPRLQMHELRSDEGHCNQGERLQEAVR